MHRDENNPLEMLLDAHLDRLDDEDRAWIENALRDDADLRQKGDRLGNVLQPLDHWSLAPVPQNLVGRVLSRVAADSRRASTAVTHGVPGRRWPFIFSRDVIAVAACIALLVGVVVPGVSRVRANSRRALCGSNLGTIFRGVSAYQEAYSGSLPYAPTIANASWLPESGSDRPFASNSRHLYLLVKGQFDVSPKHFVCPSCSQSRAMDGRKTVKCNDFPRAANVSYASMNLGGRSPNLRPGPSVAYLSDANPLFVKGRFDASVDPDRTNSRTHRGRGQTVLLLDGSANWLTSPINASNRDNVWLAGNIRKYTGVETPVNEDDAHLVPGYPATDPVVRTQY